MPDAPRGRYAFVYVALYGESFVSAGGKVTSLLAKSVPRDSSNLRQRAATTAADHRWFELATRRA